MVNISASGWCATILTNFYNLTIIWRQHLVSLKAVWIICFFLALSTLEYLFYCICTKYIPILSFLSIVKTHITLFKLASVNCEISIWKIWLNVFIELNFKLNIDTQEKFNQMINLKLFWQYMQKTVPERSKFSLKVSNCHFLLLQITLRASSLFLEKIICTLRKMIQSNINT